MTTTRRSRLWSLAALGCLGATVASAQDDSSYFYGGLSVGQSRARIDEARITAGLLGAGLTTTAMSRDEHDTAFKLFGGYQLNRYVGLEAGYFRLGEFGFTATTTPAGTLTGRIKLQGANLDLVGTWPLTERLSAIGRIGAQYAQSRDAFTGTGAVAVLDPNPRKNAINPKFGVGLQYEINRSFFVRAEAERYRVNDAVGNNGGVNVFSASIVFPLGRDAAPAPRFAAAPAPRPAEPPPPPPPPMPAPVAVVVPPPPVAPAPRRVSFSADSLFAFDRYDIRPEGKAALDGFVRELQGTRFDRIVVEGHTDRLGTEVYNEGLSRRRAEAVKAYLVDAGAVDAARVTAVGRGESVPVTRPGDCTDRQPRPKLIACLQPDRRVTVEVSGTR
ncbi:MAG: OmpA family protein [Caldimonas sp.]